MRDLWVEVLDDLEGKLPSQTFSTWIAPLESVTVGEGSILLRAPNRFFVDWLRDNKLTDNITESLLNLTGRSYALEFEIRGRAVAPTGRVREPISTKPPEINWRERSLRTGLNPRYTFDSFVVGKCNEFAHAASIAVAGDSPRTYNPLFIYGGVGLGKTHLLNAIGNQKIMANPDARICYVHAEQFMNELIGSLANKKTAEFRNKYRSMDILLMDDIQFLAGKERTQEEFFHTFNALYESHKSIVVTSDKFPKEIPELEDRLRSRFEWGLIADMQPPDVETKVAILRKKAQIESINLPDDVAMLLAARASSNVRELEGSLTRLAAFASLTRTDITLDLARKVNRDTTVDPNGSITVDDVVKATAAHFKMKVSDIKGKRRTRAIAWARQVSMYLSRELTDSSFPEIGNKIGGKDHSTVMYAHSKIAAELEKTEECRADVNSIRSSLGK